MAQTSPLLALPGELRNQIVDHAFRREPGTAPPPLSKSPLALALSCRQLHEEYQALARAATVFTLCWTSAQQLRAKTSILPPDFKISIKKLQIQLPSKLEDIYLAYGRRTRVKSFGWLGAGLTGLEELYIRYRRESGVNLMGREALMLIVWSTLWENGTEHLRKVCAIHDGAQPYLCATILYGLFRNFGPCRRSNLWKLRDNIDSGSLHFWGEHRRGQAPKPVTLFMGYSFREAEEYSKVRKQLLEGKYAEVITARRGDCEYVDSVHDISDADLKREVHMLKLLFRIPGNPSCNLTSHVQDIRSRSMDAQ